MLALVCRETGETVGFCGLVHPDGQLEAEIKYALKRRHWGRGIATEAAKALLAYGWEVHNLTRIIATVAPANIASHRVLLKAGMKQGRLLDEADGSTTQMFEWRARDN